jgi:EAL domain-containing protein (putative c-di-GMP-specific phosphodiesterase class I)
MAGEPMEDGGPPDSARHGTHPQDRRSGDRPKLERDLREAVLTGGLTLHWQPIVHCPTGRLHGFEALARWDRPGAGLVPPATFIPIAEAIGLHRELDMWVLRHALAEAARWPGHMRAAVNVSALWFQGEDLSRAVADALTASGLDPARLELEVTERVFIGNDAAALRECAQLRALGVGLSLDDFGTGYSSLGYLQTFTFSKLKLDRMFIGRLGSCRRTEIITRAVLAMGAELDMTVCAEGVAHPSQLGLLQAYGCDQAQGYLIGRPGVLTPERMATHLQLDRSALFQGPATPRGEGDAGLPQ